MWEQHTCLPLHVPAHPSTADIAELARYPSTAYVSVNVGYSPHSRADSDAYLDDFISKAELDGRFALVRSVDDVDGSHCSVRTGLDISEISKVPMIYSHSNFAGLWSHPRNITDDQARACAATGGVIGINGVGIFLGHYGPADGAKRVAAMADHIEYGARLVGIDHVGVGSDYSFDHDEFNAAIAAYPDAFSDEYTKYGPLQWVPPEDCATLPSVLRWRGFDDASIEAIYGGNFRRIAGQVWR